MTLKLPINITAEQSVCWFKVTVYMNTKLTMRVAAERAIQFKMADKGRLVYKAAKRFLDRQATGEKIGKFAVQRTLEHLKRCNVVLNQGVKKMRINLVDPIEKHNTGAHRFFWENFPQLKFKNPHVEFSRSGKKSQVEELLVEFGDGREEKISTTDKNPSQIMQEVINIATISVTRPENSVEDDGT